MRFARVKKVIQLKICFTCIVHDACRESRNINLSRVRVNNGVMYNVREKCNYYSNPRGPWKVNSATLIH